MSDVTRLLEAASHGDRQAAVALLPLVYDELRTLAAARMAGEPGGHTLDATALVHEAYLRLVGGQQFGGRGHFFAAAAEAMRRVMVDHARAAGRGKRGGGRHRVPLADIPGRAGDDPHLLLSLDDALTRLAAEDPDAAAVAKLRLFAGLSGRCSHRRLPDTLTSTPRRPLMRLLALLAAGLFAGTLIAADEKKDEKKLKDEEAILGTWKVEKYDVGVVDKDRTDRSIGMLLTFTKDGKLTMGSGENSREMEYKLDPTAKPKGLDMTGYGHTVPALYELDGDTLTICTQTGAKEGQKFVRPEGLKADVKKEVAVMTLKRVKEEKKDK